MKHALMTQFPCARGRAFVCKNIGDYVQAVASRQFCKPMDEYIEQEEANSYYPKDKEPAKMIMNGWFQWRAENWPPSEYIEPLLISMHISPLRAQQLLTRDGIAFLKKYEPVGCRDYYTKKLLESVGVKAYFSACMTLTLGKTYHIKDGEKRDKIFIVDPYFDIPDVVSEVNERKKVHWKVLFEALGYSLVHPVSVVKLGKKEFFRVYSPTGFLDRSKSFFRPFYKASRFLKTYSRKFDTKMLLSAEYITHWLDVNMDGSVTNDTLLDYAESLVKKYAKAKLLITSRIHAGLPSLGMDTPVIFVANEEVTAENGNFNTPGRLEGLIDLFRIMHLSKDGTFSSTDSILQCKIIGMDFTFSNKSDWKEYAEKLEKACTAFMSE